MILIIPLRRLLYSDNLLGDMKNLSTTNKYRSTPNSYIIGLMNTK